MLCPQLFNGVHAWCYFSFSKGVPTVQMLYREYLNLASSVCIGTKVIFTPVIAVLLLNRYVPHKYTLYLTGEI